MKKTVSKITTVTPNKPNLMGGKMFTPPAIGNPNVGVSMVKANRAKQKLKR